MSDRDAIIASIESFATLGPDWDGQGGAPPSSGVIATASVLARQFSSPWPASVTATPAGSILFTWEDGGQYQELEVDQPNHASWMAIDTSGTTRHGELLIESSRGTIVGFTGRWGRRPETNHIGKDERTPEVRPEPHR